MCINAPPNPKSMDIKNLPCDDVLGKVEDLIAGFVGFVSACYGKEVSGKKSNTRIMIMVMYDINYERD